MDDYSLAKNKFSQEKETSLHKTSKNCSIPAKMVRMKTFQCLPSELGPESQVGAATAEWKARTVSEGSAKDNRDDAVGPSASGVKSVVIDAIETPDVGKTDHPEARRPPKKRKKSLQVSEREPAQSEGRGEGSSDERQEPSPSTIPKPFNQSSSSSSAWETLMNVAALVPPLPTTAGGKPGPTSKAKSPSTNSSILDQPPCPDVIPNCQRWEEMFHRLEIYRQIVSILLSIACVYAIASSSCVRSKAPCTPSKFSSYSASSFSLQFKARALSGSEQISRR